MMHHFKATHSAVLSLILAAGACGAAVGGVSCASGGAPADNGGDASTDGSSHSSSGSSSSSSSSGGGGACDANLSTDWTNCGSCGNVCPTGQSCNGGQCQAACVSPQVACPGEPGCFDLTKDMGNCGACGVACLPPQGGAVIPTVACVASQCVFTCPGTTGGGSSSGGDGGAPAEGGAAGDAGDAGVVDAGGAPSDAGVVTITTCGADSGGAPGCYDLTSTNDHCGACDKACPAGQICTESTCCPSGNQLCGGKCVDVTSDPANCGACGANCPAPATCSAGKCIGYTTTEPTGVTFQDACSMPGSASVLTNTGIWKATQLMGMPFPFTFFGTSQTQFWLQSQGTMGLGAAGNPFGYPDCTNPEYTYAALVAFGEEEMATGTKGVCYATGGTAPNRQFVTTWNGATLLDDPGSTLTFSIVLNETSGVIDFQYQTASGPDGGTDSTIQGTTATVGIQAPNGGSFVYSAYSCAAPFLKQTPFVVRFTPAGH